MFIGGAKMSDYTVLPGSSGSSFIEEQKEIKGIYFTAVERKEDQRVYDMLNDKLTCLEIDIKLHEEELTDIERMTADIILSMELKAEIQLRIDWL